MVDPIDGSLNAKRGIPFFSISIAVAEGDTMDDVVFGYVYDFGARRGVDRDTRRRGVPRRRAITERPKDELEILSFEATTPAYVSENVARFPGVAHRLRSWARSRSRSATLLPGESTVSFSLKPARSVDIAAAQLLVREQGLAIDLPEPAVRLGAARSRGTVACGRCRV